MQPTYQRSPLLGDSVHGFFGRHGGVSEDIFESLNTGFGSKDDRAKVQENRDRCMMALEAQTLITAYQTHSAKAAFVSELPSAPIHADALVTAKARVAVGVLTADCVPVLFAGSGLVGAAHAGWRGSLAGILEATISLMVEKGAKVSDLKCAIGPCLRAPLFEVGEDLVEALCRIYPEAKRFLTTGAQPGKSIYDHVGFVRWRLEAAGIPPAHIDDVGGCTLTSPETYFSYRASRKAGLDAYGRNLSAIVRKDG